MKNTKQFYSHLIEIDILTIELDTLELSHEQKAHLLDLVHSSIHHKVIHTILSELPEEEKKVFLYLLASEEHETIWQHLEMKTKNIEEKIKSAVESLIEEFRKDIKESK